MAVQLQRKAESLCHLDAEERQQLFTLRVLSAQYHLAYKSGDHKMAAEYQQAIVGALSKVEASLCNMFLLDLARETRNQVLDALQQHEIQEDITHHDMLM